MDLIYACVMEKEIRQGKMIKILRLGCNVYLFLNLACIVRVVVEYHEFPVFLQKPNNRIKAYGELAELKCV